MRAQLLRRLRALPLPWQETPEVVPAGAEVFRALFPGGIRRGTLVEWLSEAAGSGTESVAWKFVSDLRGRLVVVDACQDFYPPAAAALGVSLADTIVVRPRQSAEALWAVEQALRCRGVGAVWARLTHLEGRAFRRLQLAAERGGTIGVFVRPARQRASPSWAQVRFLVRALPSQPVGRRLQIESLHRNGRDVVELEMDDATGALHLVSRVADSTAVRRAAGA
jgi:protein ImuA